MIYGEYYKKYLDYKKIRKEKIDLENKKIQLIGIVDIKAATTKNSSRSNKKEDKLLFYTAELEETELNIQQKVLALEEIKKQLKDKVLELKKSDELLDKVYYYKYIKKYKWYQLCMVLNFGKTRMYEITHKLDDKLLEIKRAEKSGKK